MDEVTFEHVATGARVIARVGTFASVPEGWVEVCPDCKHPITSHAMYRDARCPVMRMPTYDGIYYWMMLETEAAEGSDLT